VYVLNASLITRGTEEEEDEERQEKQEEEEEEVREAVNKVDAERNMRGTRRRRSSKRVDFRRYVGR